MTNTSKSPWLVRWSKLDGTGRRLREWERRYYTEPEAQEAAERQRALGRKAAVWFSPVPERVTQ